MNRRDLLAGAAAALTLAACGKGGSGSSRLLRVGSQKGGTKAAITASGALDGANYTVEWAEFAAAQDLLEALGSGAIDVGVVGDAPFQFAYQAGKPIKAVSALEMTSPQPGTTAIMVPPQSKIRVPVDLAGKRIATGRGSIGHYLLLRVIERAGLASDRVNIIFVSPSDAQAALQSGTIDGWSTWSPYTALAAASKDHIAFDGRDYFVGYGFEVAHESAIAHKRDILSDFLRREAKAYIWVSEHPDAFARVLSRETGLPLPIARVATVTNGRLRAPIDDRLIARQSDVLATFVKAGALKPVRPVKDGFVAGL